MNRMFRLVALLSLTLAGAAGAKMAELGQALEREARSLHDGDAAATDGDRTGHP